MNKVVFLTGATGFVGGNLAAQILKRTPGTRLLVLVRGGSQEESRRRFCETLLTFDPEIPMDQMSSRVAVLQGDIAIRNLGLSWSDFGKVVRETTHVIHSAASVQFDLPLDRSRAINYEGTKNVMAAAQLMQREGRLKRIGYVGTAYVSGNRVSLIFGYAIAK